MNIVRATSVFVLSLIASATACTTSTEPTSSTESNLDSDSAATCACALDQVCTSAGRCVARPDQDPAQVFANLELLQQVSIHDTDLLGDIGAAQASFNAGQPLPPDTRPKWETDGNEDCFFEVDTTYPSTYGQGQYWPTTPGLDAGKISFAVTSARGPIELDAMNDGTPTDWGYSHDKVPAALSGGGAVFPDFFSAKYLPAGKAVSVKLAGGADVAAHSITGEMPRAFEITAPAVEGSSATSPLGADLTVKWSPAQPSAFMEIFITMEMGQDVALTSCKVKDDGAVVIPKAALGIFDGEVGIQLRRTTERLTQVKQADGKVIQASVLGRNARIGTFTLTQ